MEPKEKLQAILKMTVGDGTLKKIVFSKAENREILRTEGKAVTVKGKPCIQLESFYTDGKARHRNLPAEEAADLLLAEFEGYRQLNILTTGGDAEARISSKGKLTVMGNPGKGEKVAPASHDKEKNHILKEGTPYDFLIALGVTDEAGRVFDKKRSKYRQIDRFLQYVRDIYEKLPGEGELYVLDLCCGKSYLTFAAYWFLTACMGRTVKMTGADRKEDMMALCTGIAEKLRYDGLRFLCCDILTFLPERTPDMVLSLHACDIATDIVLSAAARFEARVILSTPCCHHRVFSQLNGGSELEKLLAPVMEQSLLKQKFAVALTDALRCKRLEASGYRVEVVELIDPEDTPKNLMIRAVRSPMPDAEKMKYRKQFDALQGLAGIELFPAYREDF